MADNESGQEKTHEPTEKRKKESRDKGQVPRSREVTATFGLVVGAASVILCAEYMAVRVYAVFTSCMNHITEPDMGRPEAISLGGEVTLALAGIVALPLAINWVGAALVGGIQGRGAISKEPFKLDWSRVNPLKGLKKRFFSSQPFVELAKGLLKLLLIGWLVVRELDVLVESLPSLMYREPAAAFFALQDVAMLLLQKAVPVAVIIAVLDYAYQWYQNHEQLMMTREEVKEEHKQSDGDPHMKQARKQRAREIANAQTIQKVKQADVIITNPTHYAVALRYRKSEAPAPVVVAMGVDAMAQRIKAEGQRNDVPRIENRLLARALYANGTVGQMIPEDLYGAVAQVLAVIWKKRRPTM